MGRPSWTTRLTVEQCLLLTVESFTRARTWECPSGTTGTSSWTVPQGSLGKIDYIIQNDGDVLAIRIPRQDTRLCGELRRLEESLIPIATTPAHLGGKRHWFQCPIMRDGKPCGKRVGRLYLPPSASVFGCKLCYNLTYRSSQEHDKMRNAFARNPLGLLVALR